MSYRSKLSMSLSVTMLAMVGCGLSFYAMPALANTGIDASTVQGEPLESQSLYVDSAAGEDVEIAGTANAPFKTITYALSQAESGMVIQLRSGTYSAQTGEQFPLVIPDGVTLQGNETSQGQGITIWGGARFASSWWGRQNIAVLAKGDSQIVGVTVTNPQSRGTGIWVESAQATIRHCTLTKNLRDGIFVAGRSTPQIENNKFWQNTANGLTVADDSDGKIQNNVFEDTGFGISVSENASPEILNNHILENVDGIVVSHKSKPSIFGNHITNNRRDGVVAIAQSMPNLGSAAQSGGNIIRGNGRHAIHNASSNTQLSMMGNDIQEPVSTATSSQITTVSGVELPPVASTSTSSPPKVAAQSQEGQSMISLDVLKERLENASSISIDGRKYLSAEDMLDLVR